MKFNERKRFVLKLYCGTALTKNGKKYAFFTKPLTQIQMEYITLSQGGALS
jgi:hypothetical protein